MRRRANEQRLSHAFIERVCTDWAKQHPRRDFAPALKKLNKETMCAYISVHKYENEYLWKKRYLAKLHFRVVITDLLKNQVFRLA